jgi:hypothetical protein
LVGFFVLCREPPPHDNGAIVSITLDVTIMDEEINTRR